MEMDARSARQWLEAMNSEGFDVEKCEKEALDLALESLEKHSITFTKEGENGEHFCPFCLTKMARNNQGFLGRYCHWCGHRLTPKIYPENNKKEEE